MEELSMVFAIPLLFLTICVIFILINTCYSSYYARKNGQTGGKMTAKVSIVNISNMANSAPPSPSSKRKPRKGSLKGKKGTTTQGNDLCYNNTSSIILMSEREAPPSYASLFDNPKISRSNKDSNYDNANWLHPNSAYQQDLDQSYSTTNNQSAVLYL